MIISVIYIYKLNQQQLVKQQVLTILYYNLSQQQQTNMRTKLQSNNQYFKNQNYLNLSQSTQPPKTSKSNQNIDANQYTIKNSQSNIQCISLNYGTAQTKDNLQKSPFKTEIRQREINKNIGIYKNLVQEYQNGKTSKNTKSMAKSNKNFTSYFKQNNANNSHNKLIETAAQSSNQKNIKVTIQSGRMSKLVRDKTQQHIKVQDNSFAPRFSNNISNLSPNKYKQSQKVHTSQFQIQKPKNTNKQLVQNSLFQNSKKWKTCYQQNYSFMHKNNEEDINCKTVFGDKQIQKIHMRPKVSSQALISQGVMTDIKMSYIQETQAIINQLNYQLKKQKQNTALVSDKLQKIIDQNQNLKRQIDDFKKINEQQQMKSINSIQYIKGGRQNRKTSLIKQNRIGSLSLSSSQGLRNIKTKQYQINQQENSSIKQLKSMQEKLKAVVLRWNNPQQNLKNLDKEIQLKLLTKKVKQLQMHLQKSLKQQQVQTQFFNKMINKESQIQLKTENKYIQYEQFKMLTQNKQIQTQKQKGLQQNQQMKMNEKNGIQQQKYITSAKKQQIKMMLQDMIIKKSLQMQKYVMKLPKYEQKIKKLQQIIYQLAYQRNLQIEDAINKTTHSYDKVEPNLGDWENPSIQYSQIKIMEVDEKQSKQSKLRYIEILQKHQQKQVNTSQIYISVSEHKKILENQSNKFETALKYMKLQLRQMQQKALLNEQKSASKIKKLKQILKYVKQNTLSCNMQNFDNFYEQYSHILENKKHLSHKLMQMIEIEQRKNSKAWQLQKQLNEIRKQKKQLIDKCVILQNYIQKNINGGKDSQNFIIEGIFIDKNEFDKQTNKICTYFIEQNQYQSSQGQNAIQWIKYIQKTMKENIKEIQNKLNQT